MPKELKIKLFADGADLNAMLDLYKSGLVKGFTTNPSLMRKAGVKNYESFAREVLKAIPDLPISFEVFSDEFDQMEREALKIKSWGTNIYVKIPITNTRGESSIPLIKKLSTQGLALNVTAILLIEQVEDVINVLNPNVNSIVSVFAGRIADTGRDPMPHMKECAAICKKNRKAELLWASSRELLNIFQAEETGCHIITATPEILNKLKNVDRDLKEYSLDTVITFYKDASAAGYKII